MVYMQKKIASAIKIFKAMDPQKDTPLNYVNSTETLTEVVTLHIY